MPREPLTLLLAREITALRPEDVNARALAHSKTCLADAIGVALAGSREEATRILLRTPGVATAPGPCLVMGTKRRTTALEAALVNGTASHVLDYDDFSGVFGGHHTVPLMSALFAIAQERGYSGRALLLAYVVGVEVEIRLARAVHFHHYDKGWHPTATLGVFGAAAAVARLIGLDAGRSATALAIAASCASGLKANFGTMTKPLHAGQCGRDGLMAALLAEAGFEANLEVLEHAQGFLEVYNGRGLYTTAPLEEPWSAPFAIEGDHVALKPYPCCGSTHAAIAAMLRLVGEEGVGPESVAAIEIGLPERRLRHTNTPIPETSAEAKFSVQYVTVRALVSGAVRLAHFESDAHREPEVRRLLALTRAQAITGLADDAPEQWGAEVTARLTDGRVLTRRVDSLVGAVGSVGREVLREKFMDCATRGIASEAADRLFDALQSLEAAPDLREIAGLLEAGGPPQGRHAARRS